jgi:uncharacterized protein (DUF486 family)
MRGVYAILLLVASNIFMTTAWYYHVRKVEWSMLAAIGISWLIALPEYCLQVPANRLGHVAFGGPFTAPQLKVIQEAVTIIVFAVFSTLVLKEKLRGTDWIAFGLIMAAVVVSQAGRMR